MPGVTVALAYGVCDSFPALYLFLGCIPAEEMQLVMKHVPGCSAVDVDEMIQAIDRQGYDNPGDGQTNWAMFSKQHFSYFLSFSNDI